MTDPSHPENVNLRSMNSFLEGRKACNTFWKNPSKQLKQQAWMLKTIAFGKLHIIELTPPMSFQHVKFLKA